MSRVSRTFGISIRWWLALMFAAIASLTALSVAEVFNRRAEDALRGQARDLAIGSSVSATQPIVRALRRGELAEVAPLVADRRQFALWVVGPDGTLLTDPSSRSVDFENIAGGAAIVRATLTRGRFVRESADGKTYVVGLRLPNRQGAVVTFTRRPELLTQLGVVRDQIARAALIAVAIGAIVGMLIAALIAARLRRIARMAATIEAGAFDLPLRPRFHDELGALAETFNQMRLRLSASFTALEAERDRFLQLLEGLHEGVVAVGREMRIAFTNSAARSLYRERPFREGDLVPEYWRDFRLRHFVAGLLADMSVRTARIEAGDRVYDLTGIPSSGVAPEAILVFSDVSERERRERAEREFIANAAHELGTPLTAIQSSLEVLQSGAKVDATERDEFLALIGRQTKRLARLRRALLALARAQTQAETIQLQPVALDGLLARIAGELSQIAGDVEVVTEAESGLAAQAHPELLEQVLLNLGENALAHSNGSRVELVARGFGGKLAVIEVRDDGDGIAVDQERLFDRFYRGDEGNGFGLGLAIVHEAVHALGGKIAVESRTGGGTTFTISLAAAPVPVA
jgi:signal transduction histidine kinase